MFEFKIKTLDGRTHNFTSEDNTTIADLKQEIFQRLNIEVDRQRLLYRGRSLDDTQVLSTLNLAGYTMHLVTRPPPQARSATEANTPNTDEPNSDHNREQIRNIISELLTNFGDYSNLGQVSVNNEGNRMDITVNIPSQNRLSLARLRYNYQQRLLSQAREVLAYACDETRPPRLSDHERLQQTNPYDIGENDERLVELTTDPLPVRHLADMIDDVMAIWNESQPNLRYWQSVLRRQQTTEHISSAERQRVHDTSSRLIHLFSHMLHIMSDYLVEFHESSNGTAQRRATRPTTTRNAATTETSSETAPEVPLMTDMATSANLNDEIPLTAGCGESAAVEALNASRENPSRDSLSSQPNTQTSTANRVPSNNTPEANTTSTSQTAATRDRSQYLYVYSEVPAQVVQVRLDVDSDPTDLRSIAQHFRNNPPNRRMPPSTTVPPPANTATTGGYSTNPRSSSVGSQSRNRQFAAGQTNTTSTTSMATAPSNEDRLRPNVTTSGITDTATTQGPVLLTNAQGRTHTRSVNEPSVTGSSSNRLEHLLETIPMLHNNLSIPIMRGSGGPHNHDTPNAGSTSPQSTTNVVDPYCRCHSRHFQHPSRGFSGTTTAAAFGTFRTTTNVGGSSGISRRNFGVSTGTNTNAGSDSTRQQRSRIANLTPVRRPDNVSEGLSSQPATTDINNLQNMISSVVNQFLSNTPNLMGARLNRHNVHNFLPILNLVLGNRASELHIFPSLIELFIRYVDPSFMTLLMASQNREGGNLYFRFNNIRQPLQNLLMDHQQEHCENHSRDELINHIVDDMHALNIQFYDAIENIRSDPNSNIIPNRLRSYVNQDIDIQSTSRRLIENHARSIVDLVMRSPTDTGFGDMIASLVSSFFQETIVFMEILCGENREVLTALCLSIFPTLNSSGNTSTDATSEPVVTNFNTGNPDVSVFVSTQVSAALRSDMLNMFLVRPDNFEEMKEIFMSNYVIYLSGRNESGITTTAIPTFDQADNEVSPADTLESNQNERDGNNGPLEPDSNDIDGAMVMLTDGAFVGTIANSLSNDVFSGIQRNDTISNSNGEWNEQLINTIIEQDRNIAPVNHHTSDSFAMATNNRFSDTYLSGMPPKRRRVAETNQTQELSQAATNQNGASSLGAVSTEALSPNSILLQITRRAISEVTHQPETGLPLPIDSQHQNQLESSFRQLLTQRIQSTTPNNPCNNTDTTR